MRKISVLLIDDDEDFVSLFKLLSDKIDPCIQIVDAATTVEGYLKAQKQTFHIIFTDYNLPHFSGVDFIKTIRKIDGSKNIPIVLVTTNPNEIDVQKNLLENVYKLKKPLLDKTLREAYSIVNEKIEEKRQPVNTEFVNSVLENFQDILSNIAYFEEIKKLETKKYEITDEQEYDYFACFLIKATRFNGVITMGFPEETLVPYFAEVIEHAPDECYKSIFNA